MRCCTMWVANRRETLPNTKSGYAMLYNAFEGPADLDIRIQADKKMGSSQSRGCCNFKSQIRQTVCGRGKLMHSTCTIREETDLEKLLPRGTRITDLYLKCVDKRCLQMTGRQTSYLQVMIELVACDIVVLVGVVYAIYADKLLICSICLLNTICALPKLFICTHEWHRWFGY